MPLILICDDHLAVHESLRLYLDAEGFEHASAYDGEEALALFASLQPDVVILDWMMPKKTGAEVCGQIRQTSAVPILMLTARSEEADRIEGLDLGADDYIAKPFSPKEVLARIRAVLRRTSPAADASKRTDGPLVFGELEIDLGRYIVRQNGLQLALTVKEIEILHLLASNAGQVFDRETILSKVWGYDFFGDTRSIDTHIKRIRQKLDKESGSWSIRTVYGVGYRFEVNV